MSRDRALAAVGRPSLLACACCLALTLGGLSCGRRDDPAYARGSTLVMAVPEVENVKPDDWDLDFLTFLTLAKQNEHGSWRGAWPGAGSTPPTTVSTPTISAPTSAGMTAFRLPPTM